MRGHWIISPSLVGPLIDIMSPHCKCYSYIPPSLSLSLLPILRSIIPRPPKKIPGTRFPLPKVQSHLSSEFFSSIQRTHLEFYCDRLWLSCFISMFPSFFFSWIFFLLDCTWVVFDFYFFSSSLFPPLFGTLDWVSSSPSGHGNHEKWKLLLRVIMF